MHRRFPDWFCLVLIMLLALFIHAMFVPFVTMYPQTDFDVFVLAGKTLCSGGKMYIDFFDHKGPVMFCVNALGWYISSGYWGVWILELMTFFTGLALLWKGLNIRCGRSAAVFVTVMMALLKTDPEFYNHPESWAMALAMIALGLLFIRESVINCCIAGGLVALVLFIKLTLLGPFIAIGVYLLWLAWKKRNFQPLIAFVFSAMTFTGGICFLMMSSGVWNEFINDYFRFNLLYQNSNSLFAGGLVVINLLRACCKTFYGLGILVFIPCAYLLGKWSVRSWRHLWGSPLFWGWFLWLAWDVYMISRCGRFFNYHFLTLNMCVVFSMLPAFQLIRILRHPKVVALLLFPFTCWYCSSFPSHILVTVVGGKLIVPQRAELVDEFVSVQGKFPDMPLFTWSNSAAAYLRTNRTNPFRYFYWGPMSVDGFLSDDEIEKCMQVLQNERVMIVDGMNPVSLQDTGIFEENIHSHDSAFKKRLRTVVSQYYHKVYVGKSGLTVYLHN